MKKSVCGTKRAAPYARFRFDWKKQVNCSDLSRNAKLLAAHVCDRYVNERDGRFWPSNTTLRTDLNVSKRTIQRGLQELRVGGWIEKVRDRRVQRKFCICLPEGLDQPQEPTPAKPGNPRQNRLTKVSKMSFGGDKTDTHYKNQPSNKPRSTPRATSNEAGFSTVLVSLSNEVVIQVWETWANNWFPALTREHWPTDDTSKRYLLPCKFPKEEHSTQYIRYFANMRKATQNKSEPTGLRNSTVVTQDLNGRDCGTDV